MNSINNRSIRWGIIGLGNIANKFASDLLKVDGGELYAVASRSQQKSDDFANKYLASIAYNNYQSMVKDPNVDAVYIATPHALHKEHTLLCLEHDKAVLCEKPFAMNKSEVDLMTTTAKEKNVLLMEALWTYFLPHYRFLLDKIQNQTYGELLSLEADFGFSRAFDNNSRLFNKSLGGGSLLDIGIYPIFAALSSIGKPDDIKAQATFFDNDVDSSCTMEFSYKYKVKAKLRSTLLENTPTQATFICERATIKLNGPFHAPTNITIISDDKSEVFDFNYKTHGYNYEIEHFNELLRKGKKESDIMSFEFSNALINTLDDVREVIGLDY
ncbi:Gfo/Idh/MocA family protein [Thalassomonas sp. M1454]|uniref:Gfo/Idh/MocA family protein n=1 Tax=Thalassomonas sp. M1454 TaxID=2594477 RepID=UPI0011810AB5|nr:Gfo/Idh/MocA family oxidoreductase [Thalassomonas sp. M1454]TRX57024.1 Gfo/Idh/MocA family oxidoreductase [Thalassomonas sp. M1454]